MKEEGKKLILKIAPERIVYFSSLMSCYEGLGIVRTLDKEKGIIEVITTDDSLVDLIPLIKSLKREITILSSNA